MPNFVKPCAWQHSWVLPLKRILPSFSFKISRSGGISFVKSEISWCLILFNHAHESLLQYSPSKEYCLHSPHISLDVPEFALQNKPCQDAEKCRLIKMSEFLILKKKNNFHVEDVSFLTIHACIIAHNNWVWHIAHMGGMIHRHHWFYCDGWLMSHNWAMCHRSQIVGDESSLNCEGGGLPTQIQWRINYT